MVVKKKNLVTHRKFSKNLAAELASVLLVKMGKPLRPLALHNIGFVPHLIRN